MMTLLKTPSMVRSDYGISHTVTRHYSESCLFSTKQLRRPKLDDSI